MRDQRRAQNKAPSRPAKDGKLFHYLIAARVMFTADSREGVGTHDMNLMVTNQRPFVTANMIGQAQQTLQMQLFDLLADPSLKILNVHIASVNYLGEMSKEEFYTAPLESEAPAGEAAAEPIAAAPVVVQDAFAT
jgi:hypothetical protein